MDGWADAANNYIEGNERNGGADGAADIAPVGRAVTIPPVSPGARIGQLLLPVGAPTPANEGHLSPPGHLHLTRKPPSSTSAPGPNLNSKP